MGEDKQRAYPEKFTISVQEVFLWEGTAFIWFFFRAQSESKILPVRRALWCMRARMLSCSVMTDSLRPHRLALQTPLSMEIQGKNAGMGSHFFLQGLLPTQRSNSCLLHLLHWQADSLSLSHPGSPRRASENSITLLFSDKQIKILCLVLLLAKILAFSAH